jgi:hypothetical protein
MKIEASHAVRPTGASRAHTDHDNLQHQAHPPTAVHPNPKLRPQTAADLGGQIKRVRAEFQATNAG